MRKISFCLIAVLFLNLLSCSSEVDKLNNDKELIATIEKARANSKILFSFPVLARNSSDLPLPEGVDEETLASLEKMLAEDIKTVFEHDLCFLLAEHCLNEDLSSAITDYYENQDFLSIVNKYKFGHEDIQIFANMAECIDYLKSEKIKTRSADGETALWCTLAVVGSVGTTLSATAIATPAGLAGWLFFKAVSIASIAGCV